jgi:hypothetical protein
MTMMNDSINSMALKATLHCLMGCAIGEVLGLILGQGFGWSNGVTIVVSILLAFVFGYSLSVRSLLRAGVGLRQALTTVLAADTLSITTMELFDNVVMVAIPGAMNAGLTNAVFWLSMPLSFVVAFVAAFPVNRYLLLRGRGHALIHQYHSPDEHHTG